MKPSNPFSSPRDERTEAENNALEAVENVLSSRLDSAFAAIDAFGMDPGLISQAVNHLYGWDMSDAWDEWVDA